MAALTQLLKRRELQGRKNARTSRRELAEKVEEEFIFNSAGSIPFDMPLVAESVLSTIAISLSPNGETFATTHGDHTVKIFRVHTGTLLNVFTGHPRTPWTVKYHPVNSNIVASGCLGYEVRVWDIFHDVCIALTRFDSSIISLAFHPSGEVLAVASGPQVHLWEWRSAVATESPYFINAPSSSPPSSSSSTSSSSSSSSDNRSTPTPTNATATHGMYTRPSPPIRNVFRSVAHSRNVRAVLFHPSG